jgi:hypothetical protein
MTRRHRAIITTAVVLCTALPAVWFAMHVPGTRWSVEPEPRHWAVQWDYRFDGWFTLADGNCEYRRIRSWQFGPIYRTWESPSTAAETS